MAMVLRRQLAPLLREQGIEIVSERRGHDRERILKLRRLSAAAGPSAASAEPRGEEEAP